MLSVFLVAGLLVVAAISVDLGHINVSRTEVKRTADAAAMAGCWELYDGIVVGNDASVVSDEVGNAAMGFAYANVISSRNPSLDSSSDVEIGFFDRNNPGTLDTSDASRFNAVRVHVRQNAANGSAVPLFFGTVTGKHTQSLQNYSTAAMFRTISGFYTPTEAGDVLDILPIALDEPTWDAVVAKQTTDSYKYENGQVESGSDGYFECSLYPTGTGSPGNRGTVDIGGRNNSTSDLSRQILHGISQQDMYDLGHSLEFNEHGNLYLNGDTGLSAAIKDELEAIIGQPRIIPIFRSVSGNGNNAMYQIVAWEGIRILELKLTGPMRKKHVTIQPAPMVARYSRYQDVTVPESDFLFTPVMLVE